MTTSRFRKLWGGAVALFVAAGLTLAGASAAQADPLIPGTPAVGNLHIVKHETPAGVAGTGLELTPAPGTPVVAGVVFTAVQLDPVVYDLTTNAGWLALAALNGSTTAAAAVATGPSTPSAPTAAGTGETTLTGLPIGAYLVTETTTPLGVTPAAPFLVTIPMTHPTALNTWLYDVYVYPKNAVTPGPVKTVVDASAAGLGDPVVYTITSEIPDLGAGQAIDLYAVRDTLPTQLTFTGATVAFSGTPTAPLVVGTHYTVLPAGATPTTGVGGADVVVKFTEAGLLLLDANPGLQVITTVNTYVNTVNTLSPTGSIVNAPALYPNGQSWGPSLGTPAPAPGNPGLPGNPVETRWGNLTLTKVTAGTTTGLESAGFEVYLTEAAARAGTDPIGIDHDNNPATPDRTVWTTPVGGVLTISGLRFSEYADGAVDPTPQTYWLREVTAPVGHELLADPIGPFSVNGTDVVSDVTVENPKKNGGFELPFTGATGQWLFPVGGALLLAGSGLLLVSKNRRNKHQH